VQTVMRRHGLPDPYQQLKDFTQGKPITRELMQGFIAGLAIPADDKARLLAMTPGSYTGKAAELATRQADTAPAPPLPVHPEQGTELGEGPVSKGPPRRHSRCEGRAFPAWRPR
jgi:hypothetical protein